MNLQTPDRTDLNLSGFLVSGRSIAASMVTQNKERIKNILGAEPYPGTLNVVTDHPFLLKHATQIDMKGKQFAVPGRIGTIPCVIYRWHGAPLHVVEVIAPVQLRGALDLQDSQMVNISVSKDKIDPPSEWRLRLWKLFYQGRPEAYYNDDLHKLFTGTYFKHFHKRVCQRKSEFIS